MNFATITIVGCGLCFCNKMTLVLSLQKIIHNNDQLPDMEATCKESLDFSSPPHSRQIVPNQKCQPDPVRITITIIFNAINVIF